MRASFLIACILLSAQAVSGQGARDAMGFPLSVSGNMKAVLPEFVAESPSIPLLQTEQIQAAERDRIAGAFYGALIGAAVGGIGFAVVDGTRRSGNEYLVLAFLVGATIGGASGAVVGAVLGAPTSQAAH